MFVDVEHPVAGKFYITGSPIKMSETPTTPTKCASMLGADNEEVFATIGLDKKTVQEYKEKKII
jgi:crotonobetainyl-CoA:carnitine CoA-transferase CaiB-like acyl-CoA transferase